ncbi:MAG: TlpA disulfide reductase family protein [bacterium]|nr:TlpA disulfide reductase family protein [bacterium]
MFSNLKIFLILIAISVVSINGRSVYGLNRLKEGQKLEPFSLKTLNGDKLDINKYLNGKNVGIVFWETPEVENYIDYSKEALKTLVKMHKEYKDKGLQIIAVYCPHEDEKVTEKEINEIYKLVDELDISFPILLDSELIIFDKLGIVAIPSFVLIDKSSTVKYILPGFPPYSAEKDILKEIKYILNIDKENTRRIN